MPIIRKRLKPSDVYPDTIRYNPSGDKVEVFVDGEWVDAPESDPRKNTTLPPRITADSKCDAAQSVADALENQINQIITAIDNSLTLFQIAGLILGLFSFGVFAIFINIALAIADYMFGLGSAAILAALPPSAYDTLKCILYCHMDGNGRLIAGDLPVVQQEIADQLGATAATILNQMLELAGEGGINGIASTGTSTGDCSACPCGCLDCETPTATTYAYDSASWTARGASHRTLATTPIGQFDSFILQGTTAVLSLPAVACITSVSVNANNACPGTGAQIEMFVNGVSQGLKTPLDKAACAAVPPSCTWSFTLGIEGDIISFVQVGSNCAGGYANGNRVMCVMVTTCG